MFFYNNPYVNTNFNSHLPNFQDAGETIYKEHDDAYDYKLVDGVWQTRAKGSDGEWVSLESNEEATNKLNIAYPDAIQDLNNNQEDNDEYVGPTGNIDINNANKTITKNAGFANPESGTILDSVGDNPFLSLIHAVGTTINSFKGENYYDPGTKEDYMKFGITNPTDQDMYINPTQFEKSPNKPWKYLEDQEQMIEREFQGYLDDRNERQPDKYGKVNDFDSDLYEQTGYLNYEDGQQQGDKIENEFSDATHLNWNTDADGNYTTANSYMQNANDNLPATQFNINNQNYQAYQYPTPEVTQEQFGGSLPKAQYGNADNYQSQGILGSEGQGYNPLTNVTVDNNIGGANFSQYDNTSNMQTNMMNAPSTSDSAAMYASQQSVNRSMDSFDAFNADMNKRIDNPALSMMNLNTSPLSTPDFSSSTPESFLQAKDKINYLTAENEGRVTPDNQVVKSNEEMQQQSEDFNTKMDEIGNQIPEYKGTQEDLDDEIKSKELGFDDRKDYQDYNKKQEEEELARELREDDIKDANKDNQPSTGDKLWNLKNRIVDSKAGQTFSKIGAGAVKIAKPLNKIFADKEARKQKANMINNAYLSDNMTAPIEADVTGSKGNYDTNTGLFRPDDKVITGTTGGARFGTELPLAQDGGRNFLSKRYPGFDDLSPDEQNQVVSQYNNTYTPQSQKNNSFDGYSDQYNETMQFKQDNRTSGYNPSINQLPSWLSEPRDNNARVIVDQNMADYMRGQIAGGKINNEVKDSYNNILSTYKGTSGFGVDSPLAIDYNMDSMRGHGYTHGLPGASQYNTSRGNYGKDTIESLLNLSNNRVNTSRYPDLNQNAIDAENNIAFNRQMNMDTYEYRKELDANADAFFDSPIKQIPMDQEYEEDPFATGDVSVDMDETDWLNRNQTTVAKLEPITVNQLNTNTNPNKLISQISENTNPATTPVIEENVVVSNNTEEYIPQSMRNNTTNNNKSSVVEASSKNDDEGGYIPQSMRSYGGGVINTEAFYNNGGEAEIDMNTYKQLVAAGAKIEIL